MNNTCEGLLKTSPYTTKIITTTARAAIVVIAAVFLLMLIGLLPEPYFWIVGYASAVVGMFPYVVFVVHDGTSQILTHLNERFRPVEAAREKQLEMILLRADMNCRRLPLDGVSHDV